MRRVIAVDWSGARVGARRKIWLAEAETAGGRLVRLESGRSREEVVSHLCDDARRDPGLAVGLDFAFSLPAWFLEERGPRSAPELWELAAREGERWLAECAPPFFGRPGRRRPDLGKRSLFRDTERALPAVAGIRPKSVFQVGGAGSVGTGSLRGMPFLARLRADGFAIWPFDPLKPPFVVEIYPRLFTGPVRKSSRAEREGWLGGAGARIDEPLLRLAALSEDAFDAAAAALGMASHARALPSRGSNADPGARLEGAVWIPPPARAGALQPARRPVRRRAAP